MVENRSDFSDYHLIKEAEPYENFALIAFNQELCDQEMPELEDD